MWFTDETGAFFDVDDVDLIEWSYSCFPHEPINLFDYSIHVSFKNYFQIIGIISV